MTKITAKSSLLSIFMRSVWNWITLIFRFLWRILATSDNASKSARNKDKADWQKHKLLPVGFTDLIRPWHITIDSELRHITVQRRNWYLSGMDEHTYQFNTVRNVKVDKHLFGADIFIKVYAGSATAWSLSKKDAIAIKDLLLSKDWSSNSKVDIMVDDAVIDLD